MLKQKQGVVIHKSSDINAVEIKNNKKKTCLNVRLGKIINLNCYPDFNVIPGI